jgi:hypothetical protein
MSNAGIPLQSKTQRAVILRLLLDARGAWVHLPEILWFGIAQYNARIFELLRLGFDVENRTETDPNTGARHSWFRLVKTASQAPQKPTRTEKASDAKQESRPVESDYVRRVREEQDAAVRLFAGVRQ